MLHAATILIAKLIFNLVVIFLTFCGAAATVVPAVMSTMAWIERAYRNSVHELPPLEDS